MPWWVRTWQLPTHTGTQSNQFWAETHIAAAPEAWGLTSQDTVAAGHTEVELYTCMSRRCWKRVSAQSQCEFFFFSPLLQTHARPHAHMWRSRMLRCWQLLYHWHRMFGTLLGGKQTFSLVPAPFLDRWWMLRLSQIHRSPHSQSHMNVRAIKTPGASLLLFSIQWCCLQETPRTARGREGKGEQYRKIGEGRIQEQNGWEKGTGGGARYLGLDLFVMSDNMTSIPRESL